MVEDGAELIVNRLKVHRRIGLPLFILVVQHLILPGDDLLGGDVTHLQLAEVGEQLSADNMLLCGPSVFLEPGLHIRCVKFHKTFEVHIQISAGFMNLFTLPILCLSLGLEAPLLGLFPLTIPIGIAINCPPGAGFFFLVNCHYDSSFAVLV